MEDGYNQYYKPSAWEQTNVPRDMWGQPYKMSTPAAAAPSPNTTPSNAFTFNGVNPLNTPKANAPMMGIQSPMMQGNVGPNTNPSAMNPFVSQFLAGRMQPMGQPAGQPTGQPMGQPMGQPGGADLGAIFKMLGIQQ